MIYGLVEWFSEKHEENDLPEIGNEIPEMPPHTTNQGGNITKSSDHSDDHTAA